MTVTIDPLLIGRYDGDKEPNRNDTARSGGAKINTNFTNLKSAVETLQTATHEPEGTDVKSTGEVGGVKFLREDGDNSCSWQPIPAQTPEGTAILSTGETGAVKFLREDGDDSSSWVNPVTVWAAKETIWVPVAAMRPTSSNGCAAITDVETTAGRPDLQVLDFDATADEHAQFQVAFPKRWNLGTVTFQAYWTSTATDTDGVAWGLQGVAVSNDGTIDVAYGTAVVVTDDNISAAEDLLITAESAAVTIAGTPADDDMCFFRVFRDVSDANDDMTEDARLIGIKLFYTIDTGTDA